MPLIQCPDCKKQVSDKAYSCIHCGCPISRSHSQYEPPKFVNIGEIISIISKLDVALCIPKERPPSVWLTVTDTENKRKHPISISLDKKKIAQLESFIAEAKTALEVVINAKEDAIVPAADLSPSLGQTRD